MTNVVAPTDSATIMNALWCPETVALSFMAWSTPKSLVQASSSRFVISHATKLHLPASWKSSTISSPPQVPFGTTSAPLTAYGVRDPRILFTAPCLRVASRCIFLAKQLRTPAPQPGARMELVTTLTRSTAHGMASQPGAAP
jgi:hypothetical protein